MRKDFENLTSIKQLLRNTNFAEITLNITKFQPLTKSFSSFEKLRFLLIREIWVNILKNRYFAK